MSFILRHKAALAVAAVVVWYLYFRKAEAAPISDAQAVGGGGKVTLFIGEPVFVPSSLRGF